MTIYYVNTGSSPNAGNGDSLRVAFTKINHNFGVLEPLVNLSTSTATNTSLGLIKLGSGLFATADGTVSVTNIGTGTVVDWLSVPSSILPSEDATYDLGSPDKQWRSLYVTTSTIYINNVPLTIDSSNNLLVNGNLVGNGADQSLNTASNVTFASVTFPDGTTFNTAPQDGAQGPQGDPGPPGSQGNEGPQGPSFPCDPCGPGSP